MDDPTLLALTTFIDRTSVRPDETTTLSVAISLTARRTGKRDHDDPPGHGARAERLVAFELRVRAPRDRFLCSLFDVRLRVGRDRGPRSDGARRIGSRSLLSTPHKPVPGDIVTVGGFAMRYEQAR